MAKKKVGIIGGGIVGTSVAYFLSQYDDADVTLFEKIPLVQAQRPNQRGPTV
mgnify:CR=1 FL=1